MIVRNLTIKIQGNRATTDSPLYLHTQDKNIHIAITVVNNKFEIKDNMLLSFTIVKPNGDEVDKADCYIKNKQCHLLLNGAEFDEISEVGQHLIQLKLYDEFRQARLSLPPFAMHVLKSSGEFYADNEVEGLQAEQNAYKLMTENRLALEMNESILISDLPTTTEVAGYVPVTNGDTTFKLDVANFIADDKYALLDHEHSQYLTEHQDISHLASKEHNHDTVYAPINHEHSQYLKEHQDISHLATKEELVHNHDNQYAPIEHVHTQYLTEHQDISHLADKEHTHAYNDLTDLPTIPSIEGLASETYVDDAIAKVQLEQVDLSPYAKTEDVNTALNGKADKEHEHDYLKEHQDISHLATKDEVKVKTDKTYVDTYFLSKAMAEVNYSTIDHNHDLRYSQLDHTHSGYAKANDLIDIQTSINNKADIEHVHTEYSKTTHTHDYSSVYAPKEHVHSYNDLTDKPTITSISGLATEDYVDDKFASINADAYATKLYVDNSLSNKANKEHTHSQYLTEHQDLSSYAKKTDIPTVPTKTSQLTNDSGFITNIPSEFVTETELQAKGYLTQHQNISHLATKDEIPTVPSNVSAFVNDAGYITEIPSQYVTEYELSLKGYLTEHQDLTGYALTTDLPTHTSDLTNDSGFITQVPSEYVTESELASKGYLTQHQNISHLATKQELSGYSTIDHTHSQFATKTELSGYSQTGHTHTGMVTSTSITRIELVDELPTTQETGVLYIVRGE